MASRKMYFTNPLLSCNLNRIQPLDCEWLQSIFLEYFPKRNSIKWRVMNHDVVFEHLSEDRINFGKGWLSLYHLGNDPMNINETPVKIVLRVNPGWSLFPNIECKGLWQTIFPKYSKIPLRRKSNFWPIGSNPQGYLRSYTNAYCIFRSIVTPHSGHSAPPSFLNCAHFPLCFIRDSI